MQTAQIYLQKEQLKAERLSIQSELKNMLNVDYEILPITEIVKPISAALFNLPALDSHPLLLLADALYNQRKSQTGLEKNKLSPDFTVGYSNLSIIGWQSPDGITQKYFGGGSRFGIYQLGIGVPLFNGATRAKIKASNINEEIAMLEKQLHQNRLNSQLNQLSVKFKQLLEAQQYYDGDGVKFASEILAQSSARLKSGDIPFSEWFMLINQSLQIKVAQAENIHQLSLVEAEYHYLTEKN
jgi:cobalt-zinc-cadmium resistance protein CzcA